MDVNGNKWDAWKFVCRWRKIWGLMSFVGLIRRWYLTVALYTFYRFCAPWRPWFCAFLYYFRTRLRLLPLSRNGLQKRESSCFFCHLSLHILQVIIPELSFFALDVGCGIELLRAEIFRPLEEHLWVWIWFLEYSFWVSNGHLLQMAREKILPTEWSLNSPSSCNFLMVSVVSG